MGINCMDEEYELWLSFCCVDVSVCECVCKKSKLDETREIKNEGKIVANIQNNISQIDECEREAIWLQAGGH